MATNYKRKRRKTFNEINITPLTDIFLVLLIIMMVVAPMLDQQGLSLAVPSAQEMKQENMKENKILTIDVNDIGEYSIDGQIVAQNDLTKILKDASKTKENGLLIRVSENSTHGAVVKLMDLARTSGIFSISLVEE